MIMSSVPSLSSLPSRYRVNWQNNLKQRRQEFSDLMTSLQTGNLRGAQTSALGFESEAYPQAARRIRARLRTFKVILMP